MVQQAKNAQDLLPVGFAKSNPKVDRSKKNRNNRLSHPPRVQLKLSPLRICNAVAESVRGYLRLLEVQPPD